MKEVWFIRHGESEANAGFIATEPSTIPLTARGHEQALELADSLSYKPELIITSSYLRTQQTAKPLLDKFPELTVATWPFHDFNLLSPKYCAGTTAEQRKPLVTDFWNRCDIHYHHGEGAETFFDFKARIIEGIKQLQQCEQDFILVFTNSHVIRTVWQYFIKREETIDSQCMRHFRDTMSMLQISDAEICKCIYLRDRWTAIDPIFEPR
ncbi:histidine phosphatase family protein [Pedobacter foliorum]|uniref:histidine phosphatase family protein n=1 Tax=Pedobacter foliorum TaxID=2739058 RepID=UPI00156525C3|nr:histidine phosphatase family protein [Pedobacter foliorum]NRF40705.1 histidine phosphatase family protein [Pedobacter foliorum]